MEDFKEIWFVDFEFRQPAGELPDIRCMVAQELHSGQLIREWRNELNQMGTAPFDTGQESLCVAYYSTAELNCFRMLGWGMPVNILDLYVEFKRKFCGEMPPAGFGLLGALYVYDLPEVIDKEEMRELAMREDSYYTNQEKEALLNYCQEDVNALLRLLPVMWPEIDLPRALLRGRYMAGVSAMECNGVPIDLPMFKRLNSRWGKIREELVSVIDADYGVYDGTIFKLALFERLLIERGISWPKLPTGTLDLKGNTFREMARSHPEIAPLRELRHSLSDLRLNSLAVGSDGRNRCLLSPFGSKTARNLPSNAKFIFGPSSWLRSLIKPGPGQSLAYIDYGQQEWAIAAVLSGDGAMQQAYLSGDPYLAFAKQAGAVPPDGTKETHPNERRLFKACALGVQYGMGGASLAGRIGGCTADGNALIAAHKATYRDYWKWTEAVINTGLLHGELMSIFGWRIHVGANPNTRALANWPVQTNGSEILRLAVILTTEAGIKACCPIHDALLIEAPSERIDEDVATTRRLMEQAGEVVLDGFKLRTDVKIIHYPDRYVDERGRQMWNKVIDILEKIESRDNNMD